MSGDHRRLKPLRWSVIFALAIACAGSSSRQQTRSEACPRLAQPRASGFPFDPTGCECVGQKLGGDYPDLACVCKSGNCPRDVSEGLAYLWAQCDEEMKNRSGVFQSFNQPARGYRFDGCGQVVLNAFNGTCGVNLVFDAATGELIGGETGCDVIPEAGSCEHAYGVGKAIADCRSEQCLVCGNDESMPRCESPRRCGP